MHYLLRHFRGHSTVAALAALGLVFAASDAAAQTPYATVEYVPANSNPPVPAGLKVTCLKTSDSGARRATPARSSNTKA